MQKNLKTWPMAFGLILLLCLCGYFAISRQVLLNKIRFSNRLTDPSIYKSFKQILVDHEADVFREKRIVCDANLLGYSPMHEATIARETEHLSLELGGGHYHFGYITKRIQIDISDKPVDCWFLYSYEEGHPFTLLEVFSAKKVFYSSRYFWNNDGSLDKFR